MKSLAKLILAGWLVQVPMAGNAQIFTCKDATGRTLTSDRPIPECADRPTRELSRDGMLKREIAAPLTPEQKRLKQIAEERHRAEETAADEQRQQDRVLLNRYFSEDEILAAHRRAIAPWQDKMKASAATINELGKVLGKAQKEAAFYDNKIYPPNLVRKIEEAQRAIQNERDSLQNFAIEIVRIDGNFDEERKRYRELTVPPAAKPSSSKLSR